ncbi:hypothetical protein BGX24_007888, partial [Mortierella sp. AD032]
MGHLLTVGGYPAPVNGFFSAFNLQTGVWTHLTTTPAPYVGLEGHTAVSHPTTGLVYVMGGFYNNNTGTGTGNNNTNMIRVANLLTVFDPKTAKVVNRIEATDANNMTGASAVWSSRRRTVLMFEGSRAVGTGDVSGIVQTAAVKEYDTASGQWKTFETKGSFPTRRLDACVVESDDGAKIIYFGGAVDANVFLNTIHILDVDSGQWTLGQPAPTGTRSQMACAYHSGFFVAFGGMTTTTSSKNQMEDVMYTSQPIVYDVNKNLWVDNFTPPDAANSGNLGDGSGSSSRSSMDAVMWGGVGAIILMMLCALVGDYWNARQRRERKAIEMNARTRELLADSEDHHSSRRRTIHKRANSHSLHRVMTPAELYAAAAQAAAELQVAREAAIAAAAVAAAEDEGDDDGEKLGRANSWNSETFSQSAPTASTSENDSTTRMNMMALARRTSNDTTTAPTSPTMATRDPQMYYLHLLNQQRILQAQAAQYPVNAQAPPTLRRRSAYTSYNNQFYIHGGILPTVETGSNEFNSLDLAISWSTTTATTAPWTTLPAGNQVWHHALVAIEPKFTSGLGTGTQGYILAVAGTPRGYWTAYDIQSKQWQTIASTSADNTFTPYVELEGHTATVDPSTGLVYVIGGFNGLLSNAPLPGSVNLLTVFDPKTAKFLSQEQATTGTSLTGANAVWSTKRGTVLLLGGSRAVGTISVTGLDMTVLTEYNPTSKQWTSMRTSGAIPPARFDACADVTDDGSKVIVYGGAANANTYLSSIYILDLTTGVWTAGPPTTGVLSQATCAYNAGQFIVFAGSISATDMNALAEATPLVFDVNKGAWATSFTASSSSGGGDGSGGNSGSGSLMTPTHPMGSDGDGPGDSDAMEGK